MTTAGGGRDGGVDLLHILYGGLGGHATVVRELTRELNARGIRSGACLYAPPGELLPDPAAWLEVDVATVVEKGGRLDLRGSRAIGRAVRDAGPRGVVWHSSYAPARLGVQKASGDLAFLTLVEHQSPHLRNLPDQLRSLAALTVSSSVVFLTEAYRRAYPFRRLPFPSLAKSVVIPNGIGLEEFSPPESVGGEEGTFRVGMMGRMDGMKDFATLIRAWAILAARRGQGSMRLLLAGDGRDRARLEGLAREAGVADSVEFVGMLGPEELPSFLQGLDLYAHASPGETMSTALLQAFATGLPVVASRVSGITNLVREGRDGLLVPPGDPEALAEALADLRRETELRRALGTAARARAEAEFGADRMADRYLAHWAGLDPRGPWK